MEFKPHLGQIYYSYGLNLLYDFKKENYTVFILN